jgi:hypothetical protein
MPRCSKAALDGPTQHTQATLPDWGGQYQRNRAKTATWYYGAILQIPTYLRCSSPSTSSVWCRRCITTPGSNAPAVAGSYCWPEGFMRRLAQHGGRPDQPVVTPDLVLDVRNAAKTLITQIHTGREFKQDGSGPPHSA